MKEGHRKSPKLKRTVKDTVFTSLFRDKGYLLQLYQALHPEDPNVKAEDLTVITLENIMADGIYNDLGFLFKDKLIFMIEVQSTWTMNILVRVVMYLAKSYQDYIIKTRQNIYGSKKVKLPKPELYVIYTGERKAKPKEISFAEEFFQGQECCLDVKVHMIYDGKKGDIINQYVTFTKVFNEQVKKYGLVVQAVRETIQICMDRGVLKEYLAGRESEVVDIMVTLFSQEEVWDMQIKSHRKEAAEEAEKTATIKTIIEDGKYYGISKQDVAKRLKEKLNIPQDSVDMLMKEYW